MSSLFIIRNDNRNQIWCDEEGMNHELSLDEATDICRRLNTAARQWRYYTTNAISNGTRHPMLGLVNRADVWNVVQVDTSQVMKCDWEAREQERFATGVYKPVPWAKDPEWMEISNLKRFRHHYIHVSASGTNIAYTPDEKYGLRDRQVATSPAKYFSKCSINPALAERLCRIWEASIKKDLLFFAATREEIRNVYESGPDSCMKGQPRRWYPDHPDLPHPTEVYAAGDITVAYIKRDERITARVVVWAERKIYGRFYGDDSSLLKNILDGNGYQEGMFIGARLLKIPYAAHRDWYCMAYLDRQFPAVVNSPDEKFFIVSESGCPCRESSARKLIPSFYVSELTNKRYDGCVDAVEFLLGKNDNRQKCSTSEAKEFGWLSDYTGHYYNIKEVQPEMVLGERGTTMIPNNYRPDRIKDCPIYKMRAIHSTPVIVGMGIYGNSILETWSTLAANNFAFYDDNLDGYVANELMSNIPLHRSSMFSEYLDGLPRPDYTGHEITRENAHLYKRNYKVVDGKITIM